jgi:hypothetical protein
MRNRCTRLVLRLRLNCYLVSSNPVQVQKLLRHQSIQTTMSYLNSDHLQQVDLVNKLGNTGGNTGKKKLKESSKPSIHLAYSRKTKVTVNHWVAGSSPAWGATFSRFVTLPLSGGFAYPPVIASFIFFAFLIFR